MSQMVPVSMADNENRIQSIVGHESDAGMEFETHQRVLHAAEALVVAEGAQHQPQPEDSTTGVHFDSDLQDRTSRAPARTTRRKCWLSQMVPTSRPASIVVAYR